MFIVAAAVDCSWLGFSDIKKKTYIILNVYVILPKLLYITNYQVTIKTI